jgi:hypothetical protein
MKKQKKVIEERKKKFQIRLTETEYKNLQKIAEYSEISMTEILRRPATINFETYFSQLSDIGQEIKKT